MRALVGVALLTFTLIGWVRPALAEFEPRAVAVLQGLDKITARITQFEVPVGERAIFGALNVEVQACFATPPTEAPESVAFVHIRELKNGVVGPLLLGGWIYASSPAIHALEHPVYDVWIKDCVNPAPPAELPASESQQQDG